MNFNKLISLVIIEIPDTILKDVLILISNLRKLRELAISSNDFCNIEFLSPLKSLEFLRIKITKIQEIDLFPLTHELPCL